MGCAAATGAAVFLAISLAGGVPLGAEKQQTTHGGSNMPGLEPPVRPLDGPDGGDMGAEARARMEAQQARSLNSDRHKRMLADSQRLVELSNELKAEVEKSNKDELSLTVVKKAAEIEKLAHDVRERMKE